MSEELKTPVFDAGMVYPSSPCLATDKNGQPWWIDPIKRLLYPATVSDVTTLKVAEKANV